VEVVSSRVYVADAQSGLQILLSTNSGTATRLGGFDTAGTAYDLKVVGTTAYVADGTNGLEILDVSNPAAVVRLGALSPMVLQGISKSTERSRTSASTTGGQSRSLMWPIPRVRFGSVE